MVAHINRERICEEFEDAVWVTIYNERGDRFSKRNTVIEVIWFDWYVNQLSNWLTTYDLTEITVEDDCTPYIHLRR